MTDMIPRTTVDIGNLEREAIERVLKSGQFVKGKECTLLEEEFSEQQGVRFGAGVNSGTSALHLSLLALDIKQGDEVITTPNTFAATINSIIMAGAKPVFVDINPDTYLIDVNKLEKAITEKTKTIIPVHLYGLISQMDEIKEITDKNNLSIIEDACQAHGAEYKSKKAGSFGDLAAFSFFPTKNATVAGDGGIILSNNEDLIHKIKGLRDHGRINNQHVFAGLNNRLSEILAAIGRAHISRLAEFNENRRKLAKIYKEQLEVLDQVKLPLEPSDSKHVYHLYTIQVEKRNELKDYLKKKNIGSKIMYTERLNELEYVKNVFGYQKMPVNDAVNAQILSLPISGTMNEDQITEVCKTIIRFYNGD